MGDWIFTFLPESVRFQQRSPLKSNLFHKNFHFSGFKFKFNHTNFIVRGVGGAGVSQPIF